MSTDLIWLLALIAAVGAACFYAGWRSAAAYLPAAQAVGDLATRSVAQANEFSSDRDKMTAALDRSDADVASLRHAVEANTETLETRHKAVEDALLTLFTGLERAGLARSASTRPVPRQVGERDAEG